MKNRIVFIVLVVVLSFFSSKKLVYGQDVSSEINLLKVDTSYAFFQYHSLATAKRFADLFANAKNKRVVLFHFGASHG